MSSKKLRTLIMACVMIAFVNAEIIPFDNTAIEKIFQNKSPAVFLFTDDSDQSKAAAAAFQ